MRGNGGNGGNGAGLYSEGILSLVGTTVSGNSTGSGGHGGPGQSGGCQSDTTVGKLGGEGGDGAGIYGVHTLVLTNTTISGNITGGGGGGGHGGNDYCGNYAASGGIGGSGGQGGGILVADGTLVLNNDTVSRNRTGSAGVGGPGGSNANGTSAPPGNSGVPGMGGGIANPSAGTVETQDAIIAGNRAAGFGPDCLGVVHSNGHNLIRTSSGCTIVGATATDLIGVGALLGPLQVNPPGTTATHALLFSSPAIDAGACSNGLVTTDQRGVLRAQGSACDIGAYEYDSTEVWLWFFPVTPID